MKVFVVFDFPEIDPNSIEADQIIDGLEIDLDKFSTDHDYDYDWYIDDAVEDDYGSI